MAGKLQGLLQEKGTWRQRYALSIATGPVVSAGVIAVVLAVASCMIAAALCSRAGMSEDSVLATLFGTFVMVFILCWLFFASIHLGLRDKHAIWVKWHGSYPNKTVLIKVVDGRVVAVSDTAVLKEPSRAEVLKMFFPDFVNLAYGKQEWMEIPLEMKIQHGSTVVRIPVKICLKLEGDLTWQEIYEVVLHQRCSNYPDDVGSYTLKNFFKRKFDEAVARKWEHIELAVGEYCVKKQTDAILLQNVSELIEFADPYLSCVKSIRIVLQRPVLEDCRETYCVAIEA